MIEVSDLDKCIMCGKQMTNLAEATCSLECEWMREDTEEYNKEEITHE